MRTVVAPSAALLHSVIHFTAPSSLLSEPSILSEWKERHHPSPSDCLTRSSISDTQLCHPEQSFSTDREAGRLTAPQRLERGARAGRGGGEASVPEGFISCPDRSLFFPGGQMDFLPLEAQFQQVAKRQGVILIVCDRSSLECASS